MQENQYEELRSRLARLEIRSRRAVRLAGVLGSALVAAVLMAASPVGTDALECSSLVVKDADGKVRIKLGADKRFAFLRMRDGKGREHYRVTVGKDGGARCLISSGKNYSMRLSGDALRISGSSFAPDGGLLRMAGRSIRLNVATSSIAIKDNEGQEVWKAPPQ